MIDEAGAGVFADFHFYYHLDLRDLVNDPHTPPRFILALIRRLPQGSMTQAILSGGEDWRYYLDFTRDTTAMAAIYDAINQNTASTGWFKKRPNFDPYPTPDVLVVEAKKREAPKSIEGLHSMLMKQLGGEG